MKVATSDVLLAPAKRVIIVEQFDSYFIFADYATKRLSSESFFALIPEFMIAILGLYVVFERQGLNFHYVLRVNRIAVATNGKVLAKAGTLRL
ncbi:MAG: hypothetical protein EOP48_19370 [Sphingobacteriales bacterium]|nr:MAG: hypothetical protein EOP48_19370 [Sphingobacteriales bacterium]